MSRRHGVRRCVTVGISPAFARFAGPGAPEPGVQKRDMRRYPGRDLARPAADGALRSDLRGGSADGRRVCREMNLKSVGASPGRKLARDGRNRPRPRRRLPASRGCARLRTLLRRSCYAAVTGDWLSGRAPRSHRGGHWFDPSIAHSVRPAQRLLVQVSSTSWVRPSAYVPTGCELSLGCLWIRGGGQRVRYSRLAY
jgi:hypothetical protein